MTRLVLLVLLVSAFGLGACAGNGDRAEISGEADELWVRAERAMADLTSYHVAIKFFGEPEESGWETDFVVPDRYRFLLQNGSSARETIIVGDKAFVRECADIEKDCGDWQALDGPPLPVAGPSPSYASGWPLVALELAEGGEVIGEEEIDGTRAIHLRGAVNHMRAILENERRLAEEAGITTFGQECSSQPQMPGEPPGEEVCRDLTFEESLEQQEPDLSFLDKNPATIDVWISRENFLVQRIEINAGLAPDHGPDDSVRVISEYSHFEEVEIEAPQ